VIFNDGRECSEMDRPFWGPGIGNGQLGGIADTTLTCVVKIIQNDYPQSGADNQMVSLLKEYANIRTNEEERERALQSTFQQELLALKQKADNARRSLKEQHEAEMKSYLAKLHQVSSSRAQIAPGHKTLTQEFQSLSPCPSPHLRDPDQTLAGTRACG
jgi:hypothetical protein